MEGKRMNKAPETEVVIRFQDCDPFGHLNNARYIDYFINERETHLAGHYGLDIYDRQARLSTNWVVGKTRIAYLSPVRFRERVRVTTRLIRYTDQSLLMEGVMRRGGGVKSVVWMTFRHFHLKMCRPVKHPEDLMDLFGKIRVRGIETQRFDTRVREILHSSQRCGGGACAAERRRIHV